jgi:hypothetical protein
MKNSQIIFFLANLFKKAPLAILHSTSPSDPNCSRKCQDLEIDGRLQKFPNTGIKIVAARTHFSIQKEIDSSLPPHLGFLSNVGKIWHWLQQSF